MTRHIADRQRPTEGARMMRYLEIEKRGAEGSSKAARTLHARPAGRDATMRLRQFIRIARGETV